MTTRLPLSKIGYAGIGDDGRPVVRYYGWNPIVGCGKGCPGCWARQVARRFYFCPQCQAFTPHMHPERLGQPGNTKKPGIVLCNFMADLYDPRTEDAWITSMICAVVSAPQHVYACLTQQYETWARRARRITRWPANQFAGVTIRNQAQMDSATAAGIWQLPCSLWISHEPADEPVDWTPATKARVKGIIIGHDRSRKASTRSSLAIHRAVGHFADAGLNWYVKQAWCGSGLCKGADLPPIFSHGARLPWSNPEAAQ